MKKAVIETLSKRDVLSIQMKYFCNKGKVIYRFLYAMGSNNTRGWGAITKDILKFRNFASLQVALTLIYILIFLYIIS